MFLSLGIFGWNDYFCNIVWNTVVDKELNNSIQYAVQNKVSQYGVLRTDGSVVVPFGKYNWIDGFDNGLARVKIGVVTNGINESKWGLIDEEGEVSCL